MSPSKALPLWLERAEAIEVLSANTDHAILPVRLNQLSLAGKIRTQKYKGRNLYNRHDLERLYVQPNNTPKHYAQVTDPGGEIHRWMVYSDDGAKGYVIRAYKRINVERIPGMQRWRIVAPVQEQLI